jgi:hypothetical protein
MQKVLGEARKTILGPTRIRIFLRPRRDGELAASTPCSEPQLTFWPQLKFKEHANKKSSSATRDWRIFPA